MKTLPSWHTKYLLSQNNFTHNISDVKSVVNILNTSGIINITGMVGVWKTSFVKLIIEKTWKAANYFYYNHSLTYNNSITSDSDLEKVYNNAAIIVLENCHEIKNIQKFIKKLYSKKKKIILVWNHYEYKWVIQHEVYPNADFLESASLQNVYSAIHNTISLDVFIENKLKNYPLVMKIIASIANTHDTISVREIHATLEKKWIIIAQITLIDYIKYMLSAKLIKKLHRYNFKTWKTTHSKAKYFFNSSPMRDLLLEWNNHLSNENKIFEQLQAGWYELSTWKNWTFMFSFLGGKKWKKIIVHLSTNTKKSEVKKEAKKLLKIPWDNTSKYLIVDSIKEIWIRPSTYEPLTIIEVKDFLNKSL